MKALIPDSQLTWITYLTRAPVFGLQLTQVTYQDESFCILKKALYSYRAHQLLFMINHIIDKLDYYHKVLRYQKTRSKPYQLSKKSCHYCHIIEQSMGSWMYLSIRFHTLFYAPTIREPWMYLQLIAQLGSSTGCLDQLNRSLKRNNCLIKKLSNLLSVQMSIQTAIVKVRTWKLASSSCFNMTSHKQSD